MPDVNKVRAQMQTIERAGGPLQVVRDDEVFARTDHGWRYLATVSELVAGKDDEGSLREEQEVAALTLLHDMVERGVDYMIRGGANHSEVRASWTGRWPNSRTVHPATSPGGNGRGPNLFFALLAAWDDAAPALDWTSTDTS